jgi:hypothetical protein
MKWVHPQRELEYHGLTVYTDFQVRYLATNVHGFLFGYFDYPVCNHSYWESSCSDVHEGVPLGRVDLGELNWRNSLVECPK